MAERLLESQPGQSEREIRTTTSHINSISTHLSTVKCTLQCLMLFGLANELLAYYQAKNRQNPAPRPIRISSKEALRHVMA